MLTQGSTMLLSALTTERLRVELLMTSCSIVTRITRTLTLYTRTATLLPSFVHYYPHFQGVFTTRYTIVQSTVLRWHVMCLSIRPSVCLSICPIRPSVCDVGGSGPHRLEILETNCTAIGLKPSVFVAQRPSTYSQGNMGKFGGG